MEKLHKLLVDIKISIDEIEEFYQDNMSFDFFLTDKIRK